LPGPFLLASQDVWDRHAEVVEPLLSRVPAVAVIGNHEREYGKYEAYEKRWRHRDHNEGSLHWFSITEGPVLTISLSCEHDHLLLPGEAQYEWLEATLAEANRPEQRQRVPWIVVAYHKPGYTSGSHAGE